MNKTIYIFLLFSTLSGCKVSAVVEVEDIRPVRSIQVNESFAAVGATYSGEIKARYETKLGFQTSGQIDSRLVEVGSRVKAGQLLMRLDPAQEILHLQSAQADVAAATTRVQQNRIDLQRAQELLAKQFASQAEVDQRRLALSESEFQLTSALAQQEIKQNQQSYTEIRADRDGIISEINAEVGQVVGAGQAVITLAVDGEREVSINIPEARVDELRDAHKLVVTLWALPGKTYCGELRELAPDADSLTRTYSARIAVKDADHALRLGMTASVFSPTVNDRNAIQIPLTAIFQQDGRNHVWVINDESKVDLRGVELANPQNNSVLVTRGLNGNEVVVTAGVHMLYAGQKVKPLDGDFSGTSSAALRVVSHATTELGAE